MSGAVAVCLRRDSLLASLLDGVRASGNRDVCVKMAPTQRGQRWGLLSMPVDEEVESLHLKFLAAPPSESRLGIARPRVHFAGLRVICDRPALSRSPPRWQLCRRRVQIQRQHILQWGSACGNARRECVSRVRQLVTTCLPAHSLY